MNTYKADLHIHTILSPCASLEMSPKNIVQKALEQKIDIIGITDHNSTRQCKIVTREAIKEGLTVFPGVEVTTKEEIHCLAYFESFEKLDMFQTYLDEFLPDIKNNPDLFGYQIVVDEDENIVFEEEKLLISALSIGIDKLEEIVHQLNGIFIPAHVNKPKNSIISQLGFIPSNLKADAFELSKHIDTESFKAQNQLTKNYTFVRNSDAHFLDQIGECSTQLEMESAEYYEFLLALHDQSGRKVVIQ
ncbi:MAG: PHP domain-containing protein [Lentimicrobiaceae bacterium]